ncbi:hypothetical protein ElyMa_005045900 [Elysia marginata]|uniref:C-type lectin domain-containing protein n=1 Tax=Elysia marginata TaxID=1093978 RepID=A0AAV4JDY2_9GAST|nr:hypothetical protein ElyMa_005045900 [Elysia marginata]
MHDWVSRTACWLYKPEDPTHFYGGRNLAEDSTTDTYVKMCFHADIYSGRHLVRHGPSLTPYRWPCQEDIPSQTADKEKIIYIFHPSASSWSEAKEVCESMGHRLAEFDSQTKRLILPQLMFNLSSQLYWSGFRHDQRWRSLDQISWMSSGVPVRPVPEMDSAVTSESSSCGATLMPEMVNKLTVCSRPLPFVCHRTRDVGQCGIHVARQTLLRGNLTTATSVSRLGIEPLSSEI